MSTKVIEFNVKGDLSKAELFFKKYRTASRRMKLEKYGEMGVNALRAATPVDTGKTADSWSYEIEQGDDYARIIWHNSNVVNEWANVAVLLQYGHATRNGGWVEGRDYISPAMKPVFDNIAKTAWEEVKP